MKALVFEARVGDKQVQGLDLLRFDDDGLIEDFTVMVRPLSATMALAEAVGEGLERAPRLLGASSRRSSAAPAHPASAAR